LAKKKRSSYEERLASIEKGRQGRETFGSRKRYRRLKHPGMSTTNKEKQKSKNFLMTLHSQAVRHKKARSVRNKQEQRQLSKKRQLKHSLK
jgi:protein SDA1